MLACGIKKISNFSPMLHRRQLQTDVSSGLFGCIYNKLFWSGQALSSIYQLVRYTLYAILQAV